MKLQIASYLHIYTGIASQLASHQIMWHNKRIHGHGFEMYKLLFFHFQRKLSSSLILPPEILSYIYHSGNVNDYVDAVNFHHTKLNHASKMPYDKINEIFF